MHKGRLYPFLPDLWCCEAQWWPGFVPLKLKLEFGAAQNYPWLDVAGLTVVSDEGVPSVGRNTVNYTLAPPLGYSQFFATIQTAFAPDKGTTYSVILRRPGPLFNADAGSPNFPDQNFVVYCDDWPNGSAVLPNVVYVPPTLVMRPAVWADV